VLLAPRPTPKLEDHPLSFDCDSLFNIFTATLHSWRPFLNPQPEDRPCCGDMGHILMYMAKQEVQLSIHLVGHHAMKIHESGEGVGVSCTPHFLYPCVAGWDPKTGLEHESVEVEWGSVACHTASTPVGLDWPQKLVWMQ
jgi:hypothetical protein